ncbi:hypothetical protein [Streptomyces sp. NPDC059631]|uniref:hypothetical protein n=1 Tax=unclassified Streptomyces TaxID=2593676 RepID=UPI0036B53CCD
MSELTLPDRLFDADFVVSHEHSLADRLDWITRDGQVMHAPFVGWTWSCPKCGESETLPEGPAHLASPYGAQHAAGLFRTLMPLLVPGVRMFPPTSPFSTSCLAELRAEAPPTMTVLERLALWHLVRRRRAEGLVQCWRQTRDAAEAAWEEILADKIRRHPAYLHPVYPRVPVLARFWAVEGKRGPFWDGTGVRLVAGDDSELCTFDLGDSPETTAALDALTELWPPRWEEDVRDTPL